MKMVSRYIRCLVVVLFLFCIPMMALASENNSSKPLVRADEVMSWTEKYLDHERLENGMYIISFINPDANAKIKVVFGLVDLYLTQLTPTFESDITLVAFGYTVDAIEYRFQKVGGIYIGGPIIKKIRKKQEKKKYAEPKQIPEQLPMHKEKVLSDEGKEMYS